MHSQSLNGQWQFQQAGTNDWLPATVPGNVHTDLLALGRIPDPFVSDNEKQVQWVAETDWTYSLTFTPDAGLLSQPHIFLVCDGLDTLATVELNGETVGTSDNMFLAYRWDVTKLLKPGENNLKVKFGSPVAYITNCWNTRILPDVGDFAIRGGAYIRKAPSHFGWDWGPMLPTLGIWRSIRLEGYESARLEDVHIRQKHNAGQVSVSVAVKAAAWGGGSLSAQVTIHHPNGLSQFAEIGLQPTSNEGVVDLAITNPQLWWPNGYGEQPLYKVEVILKSGEAVQEARTLKIGLRTVELRQEPDEWGKSFYFYVNGVPIFAKGANWIPADSFPVRLTEAHVEHLIASAAATHQNMLRVWGGGYYEFDYFYDLCDRYGILVWQDFMFSCAAYPMHDDTFIENTQIEVAQAVHHLRHRACLALWCGNNEMEGGWAGWGWDKPETQDLKAGYDTFFHSLLGQWVEANDPDTPYWPSSPSSDTPFKDPNSHAQGDIHQWDVWHAMKPFTHYRETNARFVSEFGFQSLPALDTIATYAEPPDWNLTSYIMEHHQRNSAGNGKIITYLAQHFRLPQSFESLVYLTQVLQAEAMRIGVEYWRRIRARCGGALYWQLNDCWPVASWSSIDYFGRWKALHYAARRFFAPVALSIEDTAAQMGLFVTNDTVQPWQGSVQWSLQNLTGQKLASGELPVAAESLATTKIDLLDFAQHLTDTSSRELIFVAELYDTNNQRQSLQVSPFIPSKHLALADPQLTATIELRADGNLAITVHATSLARFVHLDLTGADVIFSDNYFDLPANDSITITCPLPTSWTLDHARASLKLSSLWQSYNQ